MSEKKTIAFFGDSYVAKWPGSWMEHICEKNNYECLHLGKLGADPYFVLESWLKFNDSGQRADICVYAHTEVGRIYHPSQHVPLTWGCISATVNKKMSMIIDQKAVQAAYDFLTHFSFVEEYNIKSQIIPRGIDRYIAEKNRAFDKIIHLWSFAPARPNKEFHNSPADSTWGFEMNSGVNVMLDLSNITRVEPGYPEDIGNRKDPRANHFSPLAFDFLNDIVTFAASVPNGTQLGPGKTLDRNSKWHDYLVAWEQIKKEYNENISSR